ncbi:MAG: group II intron maturase-specific domain-containing protein, partial [Candidatus Sulfotelmatobacter sp.]
HDAEHDDEAEVDGERKEDAGLQAAGREVRLSGVYVRALLLDAKGPCLSRHGTLEETSAAYLSDISDETGRDKVWQDSKTVVDRLNRMMIGWANYFCLGPVSKAYRAVDLHARRRLRRWLCDKHKEPRPAYKRFPEASLHSVYGLVQLPHRTANHPWANA